MRKLLLFVCVVLLFTAFKPVSRPAYQMKKVADTSNLIKAGKVWAALYQQRAAEYKALCFQAYNIARERIDEARKRRSKKPLAIVTDIDETVLDNSPYDAGRAIQNKGYTTRTWKAWTAKGIADTVPGAPSFLKYAANKGVKIFYITNRDTDERKGTLKNLQLYHLPYADSSHLLLKSTTSSKESRRQTLLKKYNIVLLCGDNLPDFDALYDNSPTEADRTAVTEKLRKEFGKRYIVIPNPTYGDFEGALFNFHYSLKPAQKDSIIRSLIKTDQ